MGIPVIRPRVLETTALGAALLAGVGVGVYGSAEETAGLWQRDLTFEPAMPEQRKQRQQADRKAAGRAAESLKQSQLFFLFQKVGPPVKKRKPFLCRSHKVFPPFSEIGSPKNPFTYIDT